MAGPAEWLRLNGQLVAVPSAVCERRPTFDAVLSPTAWATLSEEHRTHLRTFLPSFPGDESGREQDETVRRLFAGENFRLGNPLDRFFQQLHDGQLTDQIHSLRRLTAETQRQDARVWRQNYMDGLLRELVRKRKQMLDAAVKTPPDAAISLPPAKKRCRRKLLEQRARTRYFRELELARTEAGCDADELSPDENYPEGPPAVLSRKQQRHLAKLEATLTGEHVPVAATDSRQPARRLHLSEHASPEHNPFQMADTRLSQLLQRHRRRRARGQVPSASAGDRQRLDLQSLLKRSPPRARSTDSDSDTAAATTTIATTTTTATTATITTTTPAATTTIPATSATASATPTPVLLTTIKQSSSPPPPPFPPPSPTPAAAAAPACWQSAALGQKTHTSFFSLLRDVFCSDPADRLAEAVVYRAVAAWQQSVISPLNDWYTQEASWVEALGSALAFLSGEVRELQSQLNLVPFLDHGRDSGVYQWIGAGRDSDIHLESLCAYWSQTKNTISVKREPTEGGGPPATLHPTSWTVQPSTAAEKEDFRRQERQRYQAPRRAFTYRLHGYRSTVGPVRSGRDSKAGRGHTLLAADRPAGATLLSLVRDAVARLPNGEGSRADVCELVRDSTYLVATGGDQLVAAAVSSALDRLQAELDPCVKYDSHRKLWLYLHRHRTEAEFETLERQRQASSPRRRQVVKRSAPAAAPAGASLLKPRAVVTSAASQPRLSVPPPPPVAAVSVAPVAEPPAGLTQTELAVQSILPSPGGSASPAPVRTPSVSAASRSPRASPAVAPVRSAPAAVAASQLQLVSRSAAALSPALAASPPLVASVAGQTPTLQSVKVVKNQHAIVHIPSKIPGAAPQLALLANGKLIPIVNQPATVKTADGRPRASLLVAPPRPVAAARGRAVTAGTQQIVRPAAAAAAGTVQEAPLRPLLGRPAVAVPGAAVQEAPLRPLLGRPAVVTAGLPVQEAPLRPLAGRQTAGAAGAAGAAVQEAPLRPLLGRQAVSVQEAPLRPLLGRPAGAAAAVAVSAATAAAAAAAPHLIQVSGAASPAVAVSSSSGGAALKHITIPVSQLSRLLQQQAGGGGGGGYSAAGGGGGALTLAQIGGRQVLIAARPASKPLHQQQQLRLQAPTQTVHSVQTVPTVQTVQTIQRPPQVVLQGATHAVSAAGIQARQLSAAGSQLQLSTAGSQARQLSTAGSQARQLSAVGSQTRQLSAAGSQARQLSVATSQLQLTPGAFSAVSAVRPVSAGRPVVLSSAAHQQVLLPGLRGLQGYKLVQLPAAAAAAAAAGQARGVSVAATVHQKAASRPDLLAPLVAATLSPPVAASSTAATAAPPAVSHT